MDMERRFTSARKVGIQKRSDGPSLISGYAAVFYDGTPATEYRLWEDMVERIMPGAFDRAIQEKQDIRALFNHDPDNILGRTGPGTLRLSTDAVGLRYEIDLADTAIARDTAAHVERSDLTGSSFSFMPKATNWRDTPTEQIRELLDVDLLDVGPVTFPAYEATTAAARSAAGLDE